MQQSLSVVLPVFNQQAEISDWVNRLLEYLPEITDEFEILIVDDGSTDGTEEEAYELSRMYPQVRLLHRPVREGIEMAARSGAAKAMGEIVLVHTHPKQLSDLGQKWGLPMGQPLTEPSGPELLNRLNSWGESLGFAQRQDPGQEVGPTTAVAAPARRRGQRRDVSKSTS